MSDLIDRKVAFEVLTDYYHHKTEVQHDALKEALSRVPSAEPERKKGKWIDGMPYVNSHWKVCSECHETAPNSAGGYNFCPHCGADMRGDR